MPPRHHSFPPRGSSTPYSVSINPLLAGEVSTSPSREMIDITFIPSPTLPASSDSPDSAPSSGAFCADDGLPDFLLAKDTDSPDTEDPASILDVTAGDTTDSGIPLPTLQPIPSSLSATSTTPLSFPTIANSSTIASIATSAADSNPTAESSSSSVSTPSDSTTPFATTDKAARMSSGAMAAIAISGTMCFAVCLYICRRLKSRASRRGASKRPRPPSRRTSVSIPDLQPYYPRIPTPPTVRVHTPLFSFPDHPFLAGDSPSARPLTMALSPSPVPSSIYSTSSAVLRGPSPVLSDLSVGVGVSSGLAMPYSTPPSSPHEDRFGAAALRDSCVFPEDVLDLGRRNSEGQGGTWVHWDGASESEVRTPPPPYDYQATAR
ncbi:hypothetical protein BV25DRAFT_1838421 [Artomyces pyxidatus]|uniref:Uncharacterized protein n=1 Tax=Artomyces pyxidatus TaxID=48021 RepID=A0ACB8T234_9AGAM|nr:hypothetical protein BV25DRAFT_1838421 [Artomyces pyxidatus]